MTSINHKQDQTRRSFGDKWNNNPGLLFTMEEMTSSGSLGWIIERNGFSGVEEFGEWVAGNQRVLDAGCGNGRVTSVLAHLAGFGTEIVGVDINPDIARTNLQGESHVTIHQGDLTSDLSFLGEFDLIYCQEVLHHTSDPQRAFNSLATRLRPGGELAVYVYKIKAPVREFVDDHIRNQISDLSYEDSLDEMRAVTELGRELSNLQSEIDVPAIGSLGIEQGRYDVQRLFYHFFMKCFWNSAMSFDDNVSINYDWYHPALATRHTLDEVLGWFDQASLDVSHSYLDQYGITVRGTRPV